jgi:hypothetical protein
MVKFAPSASFFLAFTMTDLKRHLTRGRLLGFPADQRRNFAGRGINQVCTPFSRMQSRPLWAFIPL